MIDQVSRMSRKYGTDIEYREDENVGIVGLQTTAGNR